MKKFLFPTLSFIRGIVKYLEDIFLKSLESVKTEGMH